MPTGFKSQLLVIEISVAIRGMSTYKILGYWSVGVLSIKSEKDLIVILLPFSPNPFMVYIIPSLQYSNTPGMINLQF